VPDFCFGFRASDSAVKRSKNSAERNIHEVRAGGRATLRR
jgi:hypothetical protein